MSMPPGPRTPSALQTLAWVTRPGPFMLRMRERYGEVFRIQIVPDLRDVVFVSDPALIKQVFKGDPDQLRAGEGNVILQPILGDSSVLLLDGAAHMRERKLMLPPFHGERLARHAQLMAEITTAEADRWPVGEEISLQQRMAAVTLEIILRVVFGVNNRSELEPLREALRKLLDFGRRGVAILALDSLGYHGGPVKGFERQLAEVDRLIFEVIAGHRGDPALEQREDILALMMLARHEDGEPMSDQELRDELMTLLVAGHETTATGLAWAFERLFRNPEALDRLTEEARCGEGSEYADAVVRETLRLRPPLPVVARKVKSDYQLGEWDIPEGKVIAPCIWLTHRREQEYPEPHAFRPERFLDRSPDTYAWFPFGGGVRRCIGASFALLEMRIAMQAILRRVELRPVRPQSELTHRRAIVLAPKRGSQAVVSRRVSHRRPSMAAV